MNIFQWLITSSKDPKKTSLAVRGALLAIAPFAMYFLGFTEADFGLLVDMLVEATFIIMTLVSIFQVLAGLWRKVELGRWSAGKIG